jgi:hypothetical protein
VDRARLATAIVAAIVTRDCRSKERAKAPQVQALVLEFTGRSSREAQIETALRSLAGGARRCQATILSPLDEEQDPHRVPVAVRLT